MSIRRQGTIAGTLARLATVTDPTSSDAALLDRFVRDRDDRAFAALVRRHGPMVWGVCRRILRDHHDAEDSFQVVFLVLAGRATTVAPRSRLAAWLYGVACRVAWKARARSARRHKRERPVAVLPDTAAPN